MTVLIVLLILVVVSFAFYLKIKNDLSGLLKKFFGTDSLKEVLEKQDYETQESPKTLFGMESIYLSTISKDFPDLNINELKAMAEDYIIKCLDAIENKDKENLSFNSEKLNSFIISKVDDLGNSSVKYDSIKIHKTILNRYEKNEGIATLKFQTAIEYRYKKDNEGYKKIQDRFSTEFIYIIDERQVSKTCKTLGLNCPNCGAPITTEICPYCNVFTGIDTKYADMEYPVIECKEANIGFWSVVFPMIFAVSFGFEGLVMPFIFMSFDIEGIFPSHMRPGMSRELARA